ncbi:MAG: DUF192 domain-containing protein [Planctomycetota bacterium]|nr:DUF192 domain-containing protein [Planctomycetota bacterium]
MILTVCGGGGEKVKQVALAVTIALVSGCAGQQSKSYDFELRIRGAKLWVEFAMTPEQRSIGLMHRKELPDYAGMLFIYPDEQVRRFWMKNTYIPLSIAFIDSNGVIFQIEDMKPLDETTVVSKKAARFALETNKGWFQKNMVGLGDKIENIDDLYKKIEGVER